MPYDKWNDCHCAKELVHDSTLLFFSMFATTLHHFQNAMPTRACQDWTRRTRRPGRRERCLDPVLTTVRPLHAGPTKRHLLCTLPKAHSCHTPPCLGPDIGTGMDGSSPRHWHWHWHWHFDPDLEALAQCEEGTVGMRRTRSRLASLPESSIGSQPQRV